MSTGLESFFSGSMRELADLIGRELAARLVESVGGTRIFVPKKPRPHHRLASLIGMDATTQLSGYCGGEVLAIPKEAGMRRAIRNQQICARYDQGMGVRQLAREYDLTERQIYTILSAAY
ncbi:MAG: hypothetical protein HQL98_15540 [Magnetococcales bacterium]|nr:hypothetical protein [Magnetococcales bacterium]